MSAALTPDLALAYIEQLNWGIRAGAVLDGQGRFLAGSREVAALLGESGPEPGVSGPGTLTDTTTSGGRLLVARSRDHQIAVLTEASIVEELLVHDMRRALADLASGPSVDGASVSRASSDPPSEGECR